MASAGLRVLGVARATHAGPPWPASPRELDFEFLGLVGLADPLRASVVEAVRECRSAGIKAVMITGDYPATASAIAHQAGLERGELVTGEQLEKLSEAELAGRVETASVFARISPNQKLRIVNAYKGNGEIVAMTGDGVNDAPSLKAAHIGIAMGGRGTDVAREASAIVLLDDDFGSIVKAIRLGRRIYDNLRKAMSFIFAVHVPIAGLALLPLVFGLPILFGPIHIAFLEMVIDPVCSLVFEAETEEDDVMRRPPRAPDEPLFSRALIAWSLLQGTLAFALVAAIYVMALRTGHAGAGSAGAGILLARRGDRQPDPGQPLLQRIAADRPAAAEPDAGRGARRRRRHPGPHLALAVCEPALRLRPPPRRRSRPDARRRHHRAGRPGNAEAGAAPAAAVPDPAKSTRLRWIKRRTPTGR